MSITLSSHASKLYLLNCSLNTQQKKNLIFFLFLLLEQQWKNKSRKEKHTFFSLLKSCWKLWTPWLHVVCIIMKNMIPKGNYNNGVVQKLVELKLTWLLNPNLRGKFKFEISLQNKPCPLRFWVLHLTS